jgi:hypothetical protein
MISKCAKQKTLKRPPTTKPAIANSKSVRNVAKSNRTRCGGQSVRGGGQIGRGGGQM